MDQNLLSGITTGKFHTLQVKDSNGVFQDILVLIGAGGGSTNLTATLPLAIQNGVISIDLSQYSTTTAINNLLASYITSTVLSNALASYTDITSLTALLAQKQNAVSTSLTLQNGASNIALTQDASGNLLWGGSEIQLRQNAFHSISVGPPLTISGANSILIDTLFKPSTCTVSGSITRSFNDAAGTLALTVDLSSSHYTQTQVNNLVGAKQDTLSVGAGAFLNGSILSGYGLRWNTNNTPSISIRDLHFKSGFSVAENINLSSGNNELELSVAIGISDVTGLQAEMNKISNLVSGASGLSLSALSKLS